MTEEKKTGVERIAAERKRQIEEEGWTACHDEYENKDDRLALAAVSYALPKRKRKLLVEGQCFLIDNLWPYDDKLWKPTPDNRIRELEKAGALMAAEIDRLLRLDKKPLCPICPELPDCPHADNRTECWEYDRAIKKMKEAQ